MKTYNNRLLNLKILSIIVCKIHYTIINIKNLYTFLYKIKPKRSNFRQNITYINKVYFKKCNTHNMHHIFNIKLILLIIINQNINSQSYFFTPEQSTAILENLDKPKKEKRKDKKKKKSEVKEYILSGILYSECDGKWTVWINGQAYTKIGQYNNFSIDEVTKTSVTITTSDCKTIHLSVKCGDSKLVEKNKIK